MNMRKMAILGCFLFLTAALFAQEAEITELSGTVEIQRSGTGRMIKAEPGMKVQMGDLVSTGIKSTMLLKIGDAILTVRPVTRLTLEEIVQNQGRNAASITLQKGRVRAEVAAPSTTKTDFTVRAPSATASVRGDIYEEDGVYLEEE